MHDILHKSRSPNILQFFLASDWTLPRYINSSDEAARRLCSSRVKHDEVYNMIAKVSVKNDDITKTLRHEQAVRGI